MTLHISPDLDLPIDAITETFAILAKRGAGKSNAAVVMAEEMYDNQLPWVAIDPKGDWWGVRAAGDGTAPGLAVLVFGGLHGDVPLEPTAGRLVADLIVGQRLTCVLDVSEMTKADQRRFLVDFGDRLYRRNTEPLHVFCEEADEYIPQMVRGEMAKVVGVFETLVKRGRTHGLGVTLITQRSASLNKDVLTQIETLIPMRTPSPQDRKAILAWVDVHDAGRETVDALPGLASGEAFVFSPQWLDTLVKIRFRRRRTFDSGATPKVGGKPRPPATLAEVDLAAIKEQMAETIERAKADDPKELRKRIRDLERQVAERPEPTIERVEVLVLTDEHARIITDTISSWDQATAAVDKVMDLVRADLQRIQTPPPVRDRSTRDSQPQGRGEPLRAAKPSTAPVTSPAIGGGDLNLRAGARRMVESLGRMWPLRLTTGQWGIVAHLKTTGGTWSTYLGEIKRAGLVEQDTRGWQLTDAGFDYLGERPEPMTGRELQEHYRTILRAGAGNMMTALIAVYPDGLTREELGQRVGIVTTGGTFSTYLGELVRNGLAERSGDQIVATDILMNGASA